MKDGAVLANAGHFDVEIDLPALAAAADGPPREVLPLVTQYVLGDRRLNLLASGRVVNLAAGQGHPAAVMDMSFANQVLAVEHLVRHGAALGPGVHPVPEAVDREVARLKLASLGVEIDTLSDAAGRLPARLARIRARMSAEGLQASVEKMQREGVPDAAIATFRHYYEQLEAGASGMVPEDTIEPVRELPDAEALPAGDAPLDEAVVIKLNGGLGTSMGMSRAKSLLEVKDGLAFLDVIARQVLALRAESGARLPLVLMNSFYTRDDSLALLERYDGPRRRRAVRLRPAQGAQAAGRRADARPSGRPTRASSGARPGHGDIYPALLTSGMLAALLERGYRYAFVSNSDNLGATLDPRILAWFAGEGLPVRGRGDRPHARPTARAATSRR